MLLGQKISDRVAEMRNLPQGHRPALGLPPSRLDRARRPRDQDPRAARDHRLGEADLRKGRRRTALLRHRAGGEGRRRRRGARRHAGRHGGDAGRVHRACRQPTLACIRPAVQALQDLGMHRKVQLIVSGGIRNGADVAKALALGADAVSIGTAALVALGDNDPHWEERIPRARHDRRRLRRLARGHGPGGHHHAGPGARGARRPGRGRTASRELPQGDDAGDADDRARLRQERRA